MRVFRDANGIDWTVFEVRRQVSSTGELAFLPGGFTNGWLCFESRTAKRRLVRFPERWREFSDTEIEKLLGEALPAPRGAFRLGDDMEGAESAPPPDL